MENDTDLRERTLNTPEQIREAAFSALNQISWPGRCAVLAYPDYPNMGTHLLSLGAFFFLADMGTEIAYISPISRYSPDMLIRRAGNAPLVLLGGYLGDFWDSGSADRRNFFTTIIAQYRDREIIVLPQSIRYYNPKILEYTARIFNEHPNLTIFTRDEQSFARSRQHFHRCRVLRAPDLAFFLEGIVHKPDLPSTPAGIQFLRRNDWDTAQEIIDEIELLGNTVYDDWVSYSWAINGRIPRLSSVPGLGRAITSLWQRGLSRPYEWAHRQFHHKKQEDFARLRKHCPSPFLDHSWDIIHSGIAQLSSSGMVITNRLHGHILAVLLRIPHILIPGPYDKIGDFYRSWTHRIPFCCYVSRADQIRQAVASFRAEFRIPGTSY